ncbi:hypothetical protein M8J77_006018 [Diaphorina citri]|nr:hypothetical protein M8J77_006018 [Diaphorina citri]
MYPSSLLSGLVLGSILVNWSQCLDQECNAPNAVYTIPGDVGFMGIFNLHAGDNCSVDNGPEFDTLQNVIQTVQRVNRLGNTVSGGVSIGLHIYDACSTGTKAEKAIVNALFDMECSHTYSLGLLTTAQVSKSLSSIISNLHLPQVILSNEYSLDLPLLFNASFSFLQSIQMTTIHMAILPDMPTVTSFTNLATTYRLCVNNPMTYRHVEDSKDKILPQFSDFSTVVLVGTLEDYRKHASYATSLSTNVLFIPTDIRGTFDKGYFAVLRNGTFIISPYHYEMDKNDHVELLGKDNREHPFIQKLNQNYEFNINMKFVQNSLRINRRIEQFKMKYNEECDEKVFRNCTDLKPMRSDASDEDSQPGTINEFIDSFQVDNTETTINGIYAYRVVKSESEEETVQATALLPVEETQEDIAIEDAKKKLLLDINNTNFENIGKRDLILSSIHIVTSEAYDTDLLNNGSSNTEDTENNEDILTDDPTLTGGNETHIQNETAEENDFIGGADNVTSELQSENKTLARNETRKLNDPLKQLIHRYKVNEGTHLTDMEEPNNSVVKDNSTEGHKNLSEEVNSDSPKINANVVKNIVLENRLKHLQERLLSMGQNTSGNSREEAETEHEHDEKLSRATRSVESNEVRLESLGKYTYVNNTWIVVLNEDENLHEGNEQSLCKVLTEDNYADNETVQSPGKDCSACYNFREIYQLIELNKQDIEESKKRVVDIVFKVELKTDSFSVVIISLSVIGVIACIVILGFILYRIILGDVLEGNPIITLLLLVSIIYNYFAITPFVVNIAPNIEYFEYYSHLLCYIRLICIITSFNFIFSLLLTRCLMLSFCDHDGALMSHINGYIQSSFCFFITIIQILFLINLFLIKYIFNVDIKCDIIQGNYIFMLGYNIILLFLLVLTIPFIYKCRRNYYEGVYLTITITSIVIAWFIWMYLYVNSNYNESLIILGIFVTSTLILIIIFIPRTYHMIINIVRDNITSILPALSSQYMSGSNIHNIHYRSTQALYDIVNDGENKHLGEINPYYVSRNETKLRPNTIYQSNHNAGDQAGQDRYYVSNRNRDDDDPTSLYNEDITGRLNSSLGLHNLKSPSRSHRQSPSFKCRVRSPSLKSRANSPPQMDDLYETSRYETTSRCETTRFDTPSTMTRF